MIRVVLPYHLRTLAGAGSGVGREVAFEIAGPATLNAVLDALEAHYPMLRGTIRDQVTQQRRSLIRFFAGGVIYLTTRPMRRCPMPWRWAQSH